MTKENPRFVHLKFMRKEKSINMIKIIVIIVSCIYNKIPTLEFPFKIPKEIYTFSIKEIGLKY